MGATIPGRQQVEDVGVPLARCSRAAFSAEADMRCRSLKEAISASVASGSKQRCQDLPERGIVLRPALPRERHDRFPLFDLGGPAPHPPALRERAVEDEVRDAPG